MQKPAVNIRQLCIIMFAYNAVGKLLLYPTNLAFGAGRDLLFSVLVDFLIGTLGVWAAAYACAKSRKPLFTLLAERVGRRTAQVVTWVLVTFFILSALMPLQEQKYFVQNIFYDTVPPIYVILPVFIFLIYAGSKGLTNVGRCADLSIVLFVVSWLAIVVMSLGEVRIGNLLPVLHTPVKGWLGSAISQLYHFPEGAWLLAFMGQWEYKKGDCTKLTLSYVAGGLVVLFFVFVFYGIYGYLALNQFYALSKVALFFSAMNTVGRLDYLALYVMDIVMLFALVLPVQLAVRSALPLLPVKDTRWYSVAICALLLVCLLVFENNFLVLQNFFQKGGFALYVLCAVVLPLLLAVCIKEKKDETYR